MTTTAAVTLLDAISARDRELAAIDRPLAAATPAAQPPDRYVLLSIASGHYAIAEAYVTELERVPRITMVPQTPAWLRGVTSVRGDIVSVIDMRAFLQLDAAPAAAARLLVVRLLDESFSAGLIVDGVDRIVGIPAATIQAPASPLEGPLAPFLAGVCDVSDRLVAVLDLDRFLRSSEIRQFDEAKDSEDHHA